MVFSAKILLSCCNIVLHCSTRGGGCNLFVPDRIVGEVEDLQPPVLSKRPPVQLADVVIAQVNLGDQKER